MFFRTSGNHPVAGYSNQYLGEASTATPCKWTQCWTFTAYADAKSILQTDLSVSIMAPSVYGTMPFAQFFNSHPIPAIDTQIRMNTGRSDRPNESNTLIFGFSSNYAVNKIMRFSY